MMARRFPPKSEQEPRRSIATEVLMALSIFQRAETSLREKHRQAHMAPLAAPRPIAPAGGFHEATANGLLSTLLTFIGNRWPEVMPGRVPHRGNVTPASSGRVDGPAACRARLGKAWPGRGPGGRRFLRARKNPRQPRTSHGRHPFTQADGRRFFENCKGLLSLIKHIL